ncbi:hypothetical protein LF1_29170 [Rubripirellula obstinata]|uniref:Uncharacterized protein n=1 Tax=Rubripirellula obstinata TaxID=406547 RepID=A0A5B1CGQ5_9BACT|nr:hypothetical protein LF1_29170 [Rubripirellula obstinata]
MGMPLRASSVVPRKPSVVIFLLAPVLPGREPMQPSDCDYCETNGVNRRNIVDSTISNGSIGTIQVAAPPRYQFTVQAVSRRR